MISGAYLSLSLTVPDPASLLIPCFQFYMVLCWLDSMKKDDLCRRLSYCDDYLDYNGRLEIVQRGFIDHFGDDDFFSAYGNPVIIKCEECEKTVYIAFPMMERCMSEPA